MSISISECDKWVSFLLLVHSVSHSLPFRLLFLSPLKTRFTTTCVRRVALFGHTYTFPRRCNDADDDNKRRRKETAKEGWNLFYLCCALWHLTMGKKRRMDDRMRRANLMWMNEWMNQWRHQHQQNREATWERERPTKKWHNVEQLEKHNHCLIVTRLKARSSLFLRTNRSKIANARRQDERSSDRERA